MISAFDFGGSIYIFFSSSSWWLLTKCGNKKPYAVKVKLNAACNKGSGFICYGYQGAEIQSGEASERRCEKGERWSLKNIEQPYKSNIIWEHIAIRQCESAINFQAYIRSQKVSVERSRETPNKHLIWKFDFKLTKWDCRNCQESRRRSRVRPPWAAFMFKLSQINIEASLDGTFFFTRRLTQNSTDP